MFVDMIYDSQFSFWEDCIHFRLVYVSLIKRGAMISTNTFNQNDKKLKTEVVTESVMF